MAAEPKSVSSGLTLLQRVVVSTASEAAIHAVMDSVRATGLSLGEAIPLMQRAHIAALVSAMWASSVADAGGIRDLSATAIEMIQTHVDELILMSTAEKGQA